jgi:hypothetical protein
MTRLLLLLPLSAACADLPCGAADLSTSGVEATIDGTEWSGTGASWTMAGTAAQIVTETVDGYRITLVGQSTADGQDLSTALALGDTVDVPLGDNGFAVVYDEASSWAGNTEGSGEMTFLLDGSELSACFSFTGTSSDGGTIEVTDGAVRALCMLTEGCL